MRDAVEASKEITSYQAIGEEVEPGVRNDAWSIRVDGDDAAFVSRAVFAQGRIEETAVTYVGDAVYVTAQGQTEIRSREPADGIETRYHELFAALTAALDGADVTVASADTVGGVGMTRYYVGLTERVDRVAVSRRGSRPERSLPADVVGTSEASLRGA